MERFKYVISVKQGLHAKNAMELSRAASTPQGKFPNS